MSKQQSKKIESIGIISQSSGGIFVLSPEGYFVQANQNAADLLGFSSPSQIVSGNLNFSDIFSNSDYTKNQITDFYRGNEISVSCSGFVNTVENDSVKVNLQIWKNVDVNGEANSIMGKFEVPNTTNDAVEVLQRCDLIINSVNLLAEEFLETPHLDATIETALQNLGKAAATSRVFLFKNEWNAEDELSAVLQFDWADIENVPLSQLFHEMHIDYYSDGFIRWQEALSLNQVIVGSVNNFPESEKSLLQEVDIASVILIPINVQMDWWGFIGFASVFDDREWMKEEIQAMKAAANMLGAALQRRRMEIAILESEQRFRTVADFTQNWEYWMDEEGKFIYTSPAFNQITGYQLSYVQQDVRLFKRIVHPEDLQRVEEYIQHCLQNEREGFLEFRIVTRTGDTRWINHISVPVYDKDEKYLGQRASNQDITNRKKIESVLFRTNESLNEYVKRLEQLNRMVLFLNEMGGKLHRCHELEGIYEIVSEYCQKLFPSISGGLYIRNETEAAFIRVNVFGETPPEPAKIDFNQLQFSGVNKPFIINGQSNNYFFSRLFNEEPDNQFQNICVPLYSHDTIFGFIIMNHVPRDWSDDKKQLAITVGERTALAISNLQLRTNLHKQSIIDPLTELYNRRFMTDALDREIRRSTRQQIPFSIVMIDIDDFKNFNDQYGHDIGDMVIQKVAEYLRNNVRMEDYACRYGGDEFTLVLPGASLKDAKGRIASIKEGVQKLNFTYNGTTISHLTVSVGIASYPVHGDTIEALLKASDSALYEAKDKGKNRIIVADSEKVE